MKQSNVLEVAIEVSRVVFVPLDEIVAIGDLKADAEILLDCTDQKGGIESALVHQPGRNDCCRGVSVRSANDERARPLVNSSLMTSA